MQLVVSQFCNQGLNSGPSSESTTSLSLDCQEIFFKTVIISFKVKHRQSQSINLCKTIQQGENIPKYLILGCRVKTFWSLKQEICVQKTQVLSQTNFLSFPGKSRPHFFVSNQKRRAIEFSDQIKYYDEGQAQIELIKKRCKLFRKQHFVTVIGSGVGKGNKSMNNFIKRDNVKKPLDLQKGINSVRRYPWEEKLTQRTSEERIITAELS